MTKHSIVLQCRRVRQIGDLSKNPETWELVKYIRPFYGKKYKKPGIYKCRTFKNGIPKDKDFKIEDIEPLPSKTDLDILHRSYQSRQSTIDAFLQPIINALKQIS